MLGHLKTQKNILRIQFSSFKLAYWFLLYIFRQSTIFFNQTALNLSKMGIGILHHFVRCRDISKYKKYILRIQFSSLELVGWIILSICHQSTIFFNQTALKLSKMGIGILHNFARCRDISKHKKISWGYNFQVLS